MSFDWSFHRALALVALLCISGFASSSETAFFSLNRFQLRRLREKHKNAFKRIKDLLATPSQLLILILLINEVINISISSLITDFVHKNSIQFRSFFNLTGDSLQYEWLMTSIISMLITVPLVLIFGEITPKVIASKVNKFLAIHNSKILFVLFKLLKPLLFVLSSFIHLLLKLLKAEGKDPMTKNTSALSEEDFLLIMEEGHKEGTVNQDERVLITNVLEFDDILVSEIMTPLSDVFSLPAPVTLKNTLKEIRAQKFSRIPIYKGSHKNIIGILYVKNLLKVLSDPTLLERPVEELVKSALIISPDMTLATLFKKFKANKSHFAICVNDRNEAVGIATMEDVLESIFGDIEDERDVG